MRKDKAQKQPKGIQWALAERLRGQAGNRFLEAPVGSLDSSCVAGAVAAWLAPVGVRPRQEGVPASRPAWAGGGAAFAPPGNVLLLFIGSGHSVAEIQPLKLSALRPVPPAPGPGNGLLYHRHSLSSSEAFPGHRKDAAPALGLRSPVGTRRGAGGPTCRRPVCSKRLPPLSTIHAPRVRPGTPLPRVCRRRQLPGQDDVAGGAEPSASGSPTKTTVFLYRLETWRGRWETRRCGQHPRPLQPGPTGSRCWAHYGGRADPVRGCLARPGRRSLLGRVK